MELGELERGDRDLRSRLERAERENTRLRGGLVEAASEEGAGDRSALRRLRRERDDAVSALAEVRALLAKVAPEA